MIMALFSPHPNPGLYPTLFDHPLFTFHCLPSLLPLPPSPFRLARNMEPPARAPTKDAYYSLNSSLDKRTGFVYNGPVFIHQTHEEVEVENA
jgi:hypothetical protein